jgi:putative nucleotidyltransferase with HDIG domain
MIDNIQNKITKSITDNLFSTASRVAQKANVKLYVVGGFVRDVLLERDRNEIDFLVVGDGIEYANALARQTGAEKVVVYKNFGTAQFHYGNLILEFVGARKESYHRESRKPDVETGTFEDDINRRDFTINTMAISLNKDDYGKLIDTFNGIEDIENKIIRTPLDPLITFEDDPLRIMRAFRFASQIGFDVHPVTFEAASAKAERLKIISQERITDEFLKILASPKPSIGLELLYNSNVMNIIFPEIASLRGVDQRQDHHHKDVFLHTCMVVDNIALVTDKVWLRFAALVHDIAKPATKRFFEGVGWTFHGHEEYGAKMMKPIFERMKFPFTQIEYIEKLIRLHLRPISLVDDGVTDSAVRRLIVNAGEDLDDLFLLCRADITSKNQNKVSKYLQNYDKVVEKIKEVREKDELRAFQSPIRGDEIMKICNISPSKLVGEIKAEIEEAILDGRIGNNYDEALSYLNTIKDRFLPKKQNI